MLLRYERLQDYCFKCGRLGHVLRECLEEGEERDVKSEECLRLCVWLRALSPPRKARYGGGRPFERNRGRQTGNSGNNFFTHSTVRRSGNWKGANSRIPGTLSDGGKETSNQVPREKGMVGNITPVGVCLEPDKERQCNPGINDCGSVMVGLDEAVKGDMNLQVEKEVGYGPGCIGGPVLDRVAEINLDPSLIQCEVAQVFTGVPYSFERQVEMVGHPCQSPTESANQIFCVGLDNKESGGSKIKKAKSGKYGSGVWKRVEHKTSSQMGRVDLGKILGKRRSCVSLSEDCLENGKAKVAKVDDVGNTSAGSQTAGDVYNEVDHSLLGRSGLQSNSPPNILKPVCIPGKDNEEGVMVQVCDEIEISASRSQPACRMQ
ncbi:hypothetical protein Q3G72_015288 [Acer saccharum]|nr:hypothetical protein Q3G72_015288 [Acer saccharum]